MEQEPTREEFAKEVLLDLRSKIADNFNGYGARMMIDMVIKKLEEEAQSDDI